MYHLSSDSEEFDEQELQLAPNTALHLVENSLAQHLRSTLEEHLPFCCGTIDALAESCVLFYGKDEHASKIDLRIASEAALDKLERVCDPATFGVDQRDVLDVAYRKAGKLDRDHFATNVDVNQLGLLEAVRTGLFSGKDESKDIYADLYKLNVYGKGSFFKAHKDTPRGSTMFGSLILVFPTPHEGGALFLRHDDHEWAFDASELLSSAPPNITRIAYVAFFSDVEHEVKLVTSGHRVTLTYNLHFAQGARPLPTLNIIQPRSANRSQVKEALHALLEDTTFLPAGGVLGFGLRHLYPLPTSFNPYDDDTLVQLKSRLKGTDAALFNACIESCLAPSLYTVFEDRTDETQALRTLVAFPRVVKVHTHDQDEETPLWETLCRNFDGFLINGQATLDGMADGEGIRNREVQWVTPLSDVNRVKTRFAAYGNEPMMGYLYQRICMLVDVGPPGQRGHF